MSVTQLFIEKGNYSSLKRYDNKKTRIPKEIPTIYYLPLQCTEFCEQKKTSLYVNTLRDLESIISQIDLLLTLTHTHFIFGLSRARCQESTPFVKALENGFAFLMHMHID